MDPAGDMPLLRELESVGAWFCQYNFSRIWHPLVVEALPVSGLRMCRNTTSFNPFLKVSIIKTYHSIGHCTSDQYRQMAPRLSQITPAPLAEQSETPTKSSSDRKMERWTGCSLWLSSDPGTDPCQQVNLNLKKINQINTLPKASGDIFSQLM